VIFYARKQVTTSGSSLQKAKCQHFVQSFNMFNTLCAPTWIQAESSDLWASLLSQNMDVLSLVGSPNG
ncbi:hypothetical protein, partial [Enterobacter hormaechei]|uniref:hypothetical protein n=1 Tax=Enterobacter hormaechei TaxID=158836 RepID=UPI002B24DA6A